MAGAEGRSKWQGRRQEAGGRGRSRKQDQEAEQEASLLPPACCLLPPAGSYAFAAFVRMKARFNCGRELNVAALVQNSFALALSFLP